VFEDKRDINRFTLLLRTLPDLAIRGGEANRFYFPPSEKYLRLMSGSDFTDRGWERSKLPYTDFILAQSSAHNFKNSVFSPRDYKENG
jgi:hypothetical protein